METPEVEVPETEMPETYETENVEPETFEAEMPRTESAEEGTSEIQPSEVKALKAPKQRMIGVDIVKLLAAFLVVCIHFFLYSGFYSTPITADFGLGAIYLRWVAYCCIPIFMITTGFLMKNKKLSAKYYLGLVRVIVLYVVISIICVIFNAKHFQTQYTAWGILKGFLEFTNAQYAWYVEYYICLFAIIPFLNNAYNGLKSRGQKLVLVCTVLLITVFSESFYLGFTQNEQIRALPGFFLRGYPIAYYFVGAYIRDYPPKRTLANKFFFLAIFCLSLSFLASSTYSQSVQNTANNSVMLSWHFNDYGSYPVFICGLMLFLLFFDITCKNQIVNQIFALLAGAAFPCYLISYVFDSSFYTPFVAKYADMPARMRHAPEVVLKVFVCAMGCGLVLQLLYSLGEALVKKIYRQSRVKKSEPDGAE